MRIAVSILFILVSLGVAAIVLMQEGKHRGLGAIAGAAETYWGRNKGRSMEGALLKGTKALAALFVILAVLLNMSLF